MWMLRMRRLLKVTGRGGWTLLWALRHPGSPLWLKGATVALIAYVLSPVDLVPDMPVLGWLDDAVLLMLAVPFLVGRLPASVRAEAAQAAGRPGFARWFRTQSERGN